MAGTAVAIAVKIQPAGAGGMTCCAGWTAAVELLMW